MSEGNGKTASKVIRIGRKGLRTFAIGEEGEPFEIDVVLVMGTWMDIDRTFRDDTGKIPTEERRNCDLALHKFVTEISRTTPITMAEAFEFLKFLNEEYDKLSDFFVKRSAEGPSSPQSTEVTFST